MLSTTLLKNVHIIRTDEKEILTYRGYPIHTIKDIHNQFGMEVLDAFAEYFIEKYHVRTQKAVDILWILNGQNDIVQFFINYIRQTSNDYLVNSQPLDKIYEVKEEVSIEQNNASFAIFGKDSYLLTIDDDVYTLKKSKQGYFLDMTSIAYEIVNPFKMLDINLLIRFFNLLHNVLSLPNINSVLKQVSRGEISYQSYDEQLKLGANLGLTGDELWDWLSCSNPEVINEIPLNM